MPDLDEPLSDYVNYYRELHEKNVSEFFESLVKQANIDEDFNRKTIVELRSLEESVSKSSKARTWWKVSRVLTILLIIGLSAVAGFLQGYYFLATIPALALLVLIIKKLNPEIREVSSKVDNLTRAKNAKSNEAWVQMEPLNELYTWDMAAKLFMKTFPEVKFDNYFSSERLTDLVDNYGFSEEFNRGRSIIHVQSGEFKGNPFAISRYKSHWMGSETYFGSLIIYWVETTRDAYGNWVNVQRSQTLTASVVKPFPRYSIDASIIYGHETAPNLFFSREPSELSRLKEGRKSERKTNKAIKKMEKQARKAVKTGSSEFTVMSNKEFEVLFNATDRDNESEFRLLFTPLAQQEMVNLLKDKEAGFGDDFYFTKNGPINIVEPNHLSNTEIESHPGFFKFQDISQARAFFNEFHNAFFKSVYFAFAPIFTVPLYREKRSFTLSDKLRGEPSYWEFEALANALGEAKFKHKSSITDNLLEISSMSEGMSKVVTVSAFGYRGISQVDFVPVLGGDGIVHPVPVPWTEYRPVTRETQLAVGVLSNEAIDDFTDDEKLQRHWHEVMQRHGVRTEDVLTRAAFAVFFLNGKSFIGGNSEPDYEEESEELDQGSENEAIDPTVLAAAEAGDVQAMIRVANTYLLLDDLASAYNWFVTALKGQTSAYPWTFTAAFCARRLGSWDNFSQSLVKAADQKGVDAMMTLGFFTEEAGDLQGAQVWYNRASNEGDSNAKRNLAMCINDIIFSYCIRNKEWTVIEFLAQKAISLNVPNQSTNALSNLAISKYVSGDFENSKSLFIQALEREDKYAENEASYYLSKIFRREGNNEIAANYETRCANAGGYNPRY